MYLGVNPFIHCNRLSFHHQQCVNCNGEHTTYTEMKSMEWICSSKSMGKVNERITLIYCVVRLWLSKSLSFHKGVFQWGTSETHTSFGPTLAKPKKCPTEQTDQRPCSSRLTVVAAPTLYCLVAGVFKTVMGRIKTLGPCGKESWRKRRGIRHQFRNTFGT